MPVRVVRAAQFHEFVGQLVDWGTQGDVAYVPRMRTQLVAARAVAEELVRFAVDDDAPDDAEVAGPREENLAAMATLLVAHRGDALTVEEVDDDPAGEGYAGRLAAARPGRPAGRPDLRRLARHVLTTRRAADAAGTARRGRRRHGAPTGIRRPTRRGAGGGSPIGKDTPKGVVNLTRRGCVRPVAGVGSEGRT